MLSEILKKLTTVEMPSLSQLQLYHHCVKISTKTLNTLALFEEIFAAFKRIIVSRQTRKMLFSPEPQPSSDSLELWAQCQNYFLMQ